MLTHQYIDRRTGEVHDEWLPGDRIIAALYSPHLENARWITHAASSRRLSDALTLLNYNSLVGATSYGRMRILLNCGVDLSECVERPERLDTMRKLFERQIRFWECRPMPEETSVVVCPADARVFVGSFTEASSLFIKDKVFGFAELLGERDWLSRFENGDFAVFRLTPDKYHYVHVPVAGIVKDIYEIDGRYHSCNPSATISLIASYAKNRRVVTIIDTDVASGSQVGLVAVVEIVALMVGRIVQRYSAERYEDPVDLIRGQFVKRGQPKSLFRPGSSTVILLFERDRINFCDDLLLNRFNPNVQSRFSLGFSQTVVETDVTVRSALATSEKDLGHGN